MDLVEDLAEPEVSVNCARASLLMWAHAGSLMALTVAFEKRAA